MRADDGTIIEAIELKSDDSMANAQRSPAVRALWERVQAACECVNLRGVKDPRPPLPGTDPVRF